MMQRYKKIPKPPSLSAIIFGQILFRFAFQNHFLFCIVFSHFSH